MATIYVCTNAETLCSGYADDIDSAYHAEIAECGSDAAFASLEVAEESGHEVRQSSDFRAWNGGKFSRQCGEKLGNTTYGYATKFVATTEVDPTAELIAWIDAASDAAIRAIEGAADDQRAEDAATKPVEVLGRTVQIDRSGGQGHCWRVADGIDLPATIAEEIAAEIVDGAETCDRYEATNGQQYRCW